jgi:hypothetical protein
MIGNKAKIVKVTTLIVTFTEYEEDGEDSFSTTVAATSRTRIDSAMGILSLGMGVLHNCPDAYLDPTAISGWNQGE